MLKKYIKYALFFACILGAFSFAFVFLFTSKAFHECFVLSETGQIGDTIGGITAPFIGSIGAALTFLAFYIQFKANEKHNLQFDLQSKESTKEKHEGKILYLIKQNREIASNMTIGEHNIISGPKCFNRMFYEFKAVYDVCNIVFNKQKSNLEIINIAFTIFYNGVGNQSNELNIRLLGNSDKIKNVLEIIEHIKHRYSTTEAFLDINNKYDINLDSLLADDFEYIPFDGHITRLGQYYRNFYHILNYAYNMDKDLFTDDEKKEIIKSLRSQLSSYEQIFIYFNSLSLYGQPLKSNGYIDFFGIIRNIPLPLVDFAGDIHHYYPDMDFEWDEIIARSKSNT